MTSDNPDRLDSVVTACHTTPIGRLTLAASEQALLYCGFAPSEQLLRLLAPVCRTTTDEAAAPAGSAAALVLERTRAQLDAYLDGRRRGFELPVDMRLATPFRREVVLAVDALAPYGATTTYGALAAGIGRPGAARAVGTALGANPLCVVLPCHRVVGAAGKFTGYAGGAHAKQFLIDLES
ncbi:methylated-DNA--[protein]-cysteine S-methyltransferase [Actinacidiphila sp. bgisy144]|uniref:methylated-DNA--[protein]-cysteine S-methyltransferase n=1 Tax=Actinacidiphila sp. bgisy144 TaxID=3413791 RepID=UPI003EB9EC4E